MIDSFSILLSHGLMLLAFWRLLSRADLDDESAANAFVAEEESAPAAQKGTLFPDA